MSAVRLVAVTPRSIADLERELADLTARITDAKAALASGSGTRADLDALRASHAETQDVLDGARTNAERAQRDQAAKERAAKEAELAQLLAEAGPDAWTSAHEAWGERAVEIERLAAKLHAEISARMTTAITAGRQAEGLARELRVEAPHLPSWQTNTAGIYCARAISRARAAEMRNHDGSRMLQALGQPVIE